MEGLLYGYGTDNNARSTSDESVAKLLNKHNPTSESNHVISLIQNNRVANATEGGFRIQSHFQVTFAPFVTASVTLTVSD